MLSKYTIKNGKNKPSVRICVTKQRKNCVWMVVPWEFDKHKKLGNDVKVVI